MHGGATPTGRQQGPIRHGIYSRRLTEEEQALLPMIDVTSLDDEIRIAKVLLHRIIQIHDAVQAAPLDPKNLAGFRLAEVSITTPDGKTTTGGVPETFALIDRCLGRLGRLKLTRARLLAAMRERGEGAEWAALPWVDWMAPDGPPEVADASCASPGAE